MRGVYVRFIAHAMIVLGSLSLTGQFAFANDNDKNNPNACEDNLQTPEKQAATKASKSASAKKVQAVEPTVKRSAAYERLAKERGVAPTAKTLYDFWTSNVDDNLALQHPFTVANAAEKTYAILTYLPPQQSLDPLYHVKPVLVYPILTGHPLAGGRMVVGNEEALENLVNFVGSVARGDRSGKAAGFPGPAGTGKTELLYVIDSVEKNLAKTDPKFKQYTYRFKNLHTIPILKRMFQYDPVTKEPNDIWLNPDMPRSPFTLLRKDMKEKVLAEVMPKIRSKWNMVISKGWMKPEPKSATIIRAILEHKYPEIAEDLISINDLTPEEYLEALSEYVVIVSKEVVQDKTEPQIIRAQTEDPNYEALFASRNLLRQAYYTNGTYKDLSVDYSGQVFQQDGHLLMMDELYRNPPSFLNLLLEVKQNRMVQTDFGDPVEIDVVPVWNSNDESIEKAKEDQALKASLDRDEPNPMRLLLDPEQIEATSLFQVEINRFKMRALDETELKPLVYNEVYPAPDRHGKTETAYGRYALYYQTDSQPILIAPMALNYMSWLASASRFDVNVKKMASSFKSELNLVAQNPGLFQDPIVRLRIALGDRQVNDAERRELYKISKLMEEGRSGISSRDVETWFKAAIDLAIRERRGVLTPRMMDDAFEDILTSGKIKVGAGNMRADWQNLRKRVKSDLLLPKLEKDVQTIISGDGDKANRIYDQVEREFIELANKPDATEVMPDDNSQPIQINLPRLNKIRAIYKTRFGKEFSPNFLLQNLRGARKVGGAAPRDTQLLDAVREFLADADAQTADYIESFNSFYNQETNDPTLRDKVGYVEARLAEYGYDTQSFRDAVAFAAQLRTKKIQEESKR